MPLHVSSTVVLIIRRSKFYYTAIGIVTPVGGRPVPGAPVGPNRPWGPPNPYTTRNVSLPGLNRPGRGVVYPPTSSAKYEGRVELYICPPFGPSRPVLGWSLPLLLLSSHFLPLRFLFSVILCHYILYIPIFLYSIFLYYICVYYIFLYFYII